MKIEKLICSIKFKSACIHTKFKEQFASTNLFIFDAKGFIGEFPTGYFRNLKENCTISLNVSLIVFYRRMYLSFTCSHAIREEKDNLV